jgi:hypothetical protein
LTSWVSPFGQVLVQFICLGPGFEIGDCATPIGDLPPGINVLTRLAAADAEGPRIVEQHHEAGVCKASANL